MLQKVIWVAVCCIFFVANAVYAASATFTPLGDLPGGLILSGAVALSSDGTTVVGYSRSENGEEAFRWTMGTGMVGLGDLTPGIASSAALDVSGDGSVVVGRGRGPNNGYEAFRWTESEGMVGLGDFAGGEFHSSASGVSADGSVIVGYGTTGINDEAFRWTQSDGLVGLGDLPGGATRSIGWAVSDDGSVVVGSASRPGGMVAARWTSGEGWTEIGDLPGQEDYSEAYGVSGDGLVAVGYSETFLGYEGFRWTQSEGITSIAQPIDFSATATAASGDGSVIVGTRDIDISVYGAFVWDRFHGNRLLQDILAAAGVDLTGWHLERAEGVSADGLTIAGTGLNPDGNSEAWIATLPPNTFVPEASTLSLIVAVLMGLVLAGGRRASNRSLNGSV